MTTEEPNRWTKAASRYADEKIERMEKAFAGWREKEKRLAAWMLAATAIAAGAGYFLAGIFGMLIGAAILAIGCSLIDMEFCQGHGNGMAPADPTRAKKIRDRFVEEAAKAIEGAEKAADGLAWSIAEQDGVYRLALACCGEELATLTYNPVNGLVLLDGEGIGFSIRNGFTARADIDDTGTVRLFLRTDTGAWENCVRLNGFSFYTEAWHSGLDMLEIPEIQAARKRMEKRFREAIGALVTQKAETSDR